MNLKKLKKIKQQLHEINRSPQGRNAASLIALAEQLGRVRDNRGKEPTYVRQLNPKLSPPLSIPGHTGDLKVGTTKSIIQALLQDVDEWEEYLSEDSDDECYGGEQSDG
jgi:hypothetical protein